MISIIIPIYNEEKIILENSARFRVLSHRAELIFVDGKSSDRSFEISRNLGEVLSSEKGRAIQMNSGASVAQGDILLFLHADNAILPEVLNSIERVIKERGFIGGCLTQKIDKQGFIFRLIEGQGNFRARRRKIFYGDQGIFVRKDIFSKIGGFPEVPIMEDVIFTKKLRKLGNTAVLPDEILASPRRWEKRGIVRTILLYNLIIILFWLRFPLEKIKKLYDDLR